MTDKSVIRFAEGVAFVLPLPSLSCTMGNWREVSTAVSSKNVHTMQQAPTDLVQRYS